MLSLPRQQLLENLQQRIRDIEASRRPADRATIALGGSALHDLLPEKQLPAGALVELLSAAEGSGAWSLALFLARCACSGCGKQKVLVIVDGQRCFYPPAAARLGIDLERLIVVRPKTARDAMLAIDQSLRTTAVGAVIGWYDRLPTSAFRRLQLAAETGGGLGLLLRPASMLRTPSFAAVRFLVTPIEKRGHASFSSAIGDEKDACPLFSIRRVRLEVVRCRGGVAGQSAILEIDDETGDVRLPAGLAATAAGARAARASG